MRENIRQFLKEAGIPLERWGQGEAKRVEDLEEEAGRGESRLDREGGRVVRGVRVALVDVFHRKGEDLLKLREDRQEFSDRVRRRKVLASVSGKIMGDEDPKKAAYRGVVEELGIRGQIGLAEKGVENEEKESLSYPGLTTRFTYHRFDAWLDKYQYVEAGYKEEQPKKTTYFVWDKVK